MRDVREGERVIGKGTSYIVAGPSVCLALCAGCFRAFSSSNCCFRMFLIASTHTWRERERESE